MHNYLKYFSKKGIFSRYNMQGNKYIKLKNFIKTGRVKMNFYFQKLFKNTSSLSTWVKKNIKNKLSGGQYREESPPVLLNFRLYFLF